MKNFMALLSILSALNISYSQQWELRYPYIPSDFINDIFFLDQNDGFMVNDGGSILRTTDSGETWKIKKHYQRNSLNEIKFIDKNNGFIFSPHSFIGDQIDFLYTTDGGTNWEKSNIFLSQALSFLPVSKNELLGSTNDWGTIERLDNFFGNWETVYQPHYYFETDVNIPYGNILQFQKFDSKILALGASANAKRAGVLSDSISFILESFDSGVSWDTLWCGLQDVANTFYFINDSTGWMGVEHNKIYNTTDGGKHWQIKYADSTSQLGIKSVHTIGNSIYAIDGSGKVIYSHTSGNSWQFYQLDSTYDNSYKIKFINENRGFIVGNDIWKTTDGGKSWNRVSKSLKGNLRKIDFVNENIGMGVGENFVYGTNDGGFKWKVLLNNGDYFSGLYMFDSSNVWVVGYNSLYKSANGGVSWSSKKISDDISYMRGITFLDKNVGVVYEVWEHDSTFNYVTIDGGSTWKKYSINNLQFVTSFFKMKFTDPGHLWFTNQEAFGCRKILQKHGNNLKMKRHSIASILLIHFMAVIHYGVEDLIK